MRRLRRITGAMRVVATVLLALLLAGCGSGAKPAVGHPATIAGVGVSQKGPPPRPRTPSACVRRWNGRANSSGRAAVARRAPNADLALVRTAGSRGYFSDHAGRCLVYLVTASRKAAVFVETARGRFTLTADASGRFGTNAAVGPGGHLRLR